MRAAGHLCDVIAVTSARDADVVRHAVAQGVVLYLLKPFTFATFRDQARAVRRLPRPARRRRRRGRPGRGGPALRLAAGGAGATHLPKGMSAETLREVTAALRDRARRGLSATEVADGVGTSRVTARRYLEHLAETGQALRRPRYGGSGRPEVEYRWTLTGGRVSRSQRWRPRTNCRR